MATILVLDDREPNREFLVTLLGYAGHTLLEAAAAEEALVVARTKQPDLVIILSMHASEDHVLLALRKGAVGYLLKGARRAELELAVRSVSRGEVYLSPAASKHLVGKYRQRGADPAVADASQPQSSERLTPRQREILQLIAEGNTVKEIAQILSISVKTAETHRAQIMERLGIHDVAGLVRYAIRTGIITLGE